MKALMSMSSLQLIIRMIIIIIHYLNFICAVLSYLAACSLIPRLSGRYHPPSHSGTRSAG